MLSPDHLKAVDLPLNIQQLCSSGEITEKDLDLEECVVCQQVTGEVLKCPANSKRDRDGVGYKTLVVNLLAFKKIRCLSSSKFSLFVIKQVFCYIVGCRLQYNKSKFQRAAKRKAHPASNEEVTPSRKYMYTHRCFIKTSAEKEQCSFCGKPGIASEPLRHASTFGTTMCLTVTGSRFAT